MAVTPTEAAEMRNWSLEKLAEYIATRPDSQAAAAAEVELTRREIIATQRAAEAQVEAARYTRSNARGMFWSVVAVVVSSIATLAVSIVGLIGKSH